MTALKHSLVRLSASLNLPGAFTHLPRFALTTLLYHSFLAPGERVERGRARLHRQLEWLCKKYTLLSPVEAASHLEQGTLPPFPLVVTTDDAHIDLLDVWDVFQEHAVPLAVFPCVGWVESSTPMTAPPSLLRVIDFVRWYTGPEQKVDLGRCGTLLLDPKSADRTIDRLVATSQASGTEFLSSAWDVLSRLPRHANRPVRVCNWKELGDLHQGGATIGSHTITHCRLAECTDLRLAFELEESKRAVEEHFAPCEMFSYPFGTPDVANPRTTAAVVKAGYRCAFLSRQDFAPNHADTHCLPRITIPDNNMVDIGLFRAFAMGGHIPLQRIKGMALGRFRRCEEVVLAASVLAEFAA